MATARKSKPAPKDLAKVLTNGALPGETDGLTRADKVAAAALAQKALDHPKRPAILAETGTDVRGRRIMRIAIANDDMPFLVDSVAATVAAHNIPTNRILHPVVDGEQPTSLIYLETDRPDAKARKALLDDIETNLGHVRAAVVDWHAMQSALKSDATALGAMLNEPLILIADEPTGNLDPEVGEQIMPLQLQLFAVRRLRVGAASFFEKFQVQPASILPKFYF